MTEPTDPTDTAGSAGQDRIRGSAANARPLPQYAFQSGYAGWWSTVWQVVRFSDGEVLVSGRTFGRRHEQRAWERMQKAAKECGYAD